jgi:hypothetical protein
MTYLRFIYFLIFVIAFAHMEPLRRWRTLASEDNFDRLSSLPHPYSSQAGWPCPCLEPEAHVALTRAVIDTAHGTSATGANEKVSSPNKAQPLD